MVLLVRHEDVGDQGRLTRQEGYCDFHCLPVPVLGVASRVDLFAQHFLQLVQEALFSAHAEVGDGKEAYLSESS